MWLWLLGSAALLLSSEVYGTTGRIFPDPTSGPLDGTFWYSRLRLDGVSATTGATDRDKGHRCTPSAPKVAGNRRIAYQMVERSLCDQFYGHVDCPHVLHEVCPHVHEEVDTCQCCPKTSQDDVLGYLVFH